jgi:serine/threonine protein kinase
MFDLGETGGAHFITMEYIRGEDLKSLVRKMGQLSAGQALSIAKQVCDGLIEAHNLGVVHRDLKPQNIMIDTNGSARIMDFGIARSIEGKSITGAGVMIGTPDYMSPEQVDGKETDQRSDVYSLGVILYEMVTGRTPFEGDTALSIAVKHKTETPANPRKYNEQLSEELSQIILRCLEKERENRYQDAGKLRKAIEDIEQGIPTAERIVPEREPLTSREITVKITPKRLLIPVIALVILILAVILIWKPWGSTSSLLPTESGIPSLAVLNFKNNTGDSALDIWSESFRDLLITDLSQSRYLRIQSAERVNQILSLLNQKEETSYSADVLGEIGRKAGVETIITGNFTKSGDTLRVNVSLLDAESGDLINSEKSEGREDAGFLPLVDDLTRKIKSSLNLTKTQISSDQDMEIGVITTSNPEAYQYYKEGRTLFMRMDYRSSINLMERAIEFDPGFAMAYRSIAMAYSNLGGHRDRVKEYMGKALEKTDRLSYKEKKIIEAQYSSAIDRDRHQALTIWKELLKDYPQDNFINQAIAVLYHTFLDFDKAILHYEVCRKNRNEFAGTYTSLAGVYMAIGKYEKAREVLREHIEYFGDNITMRANLAGFYLLEGKFDEALQESKKLPEVLRRAYIGYIDYLRGDFAAAEKNYIQGLDNSDSNQKMNACLFLVHIYMAQGKYKSAAALLEEGLALAEEQEDQIPRLQFLLKKSWLNFTWGKYEEALSNAQRLWERAIGQESRWYQKQALIIQSLVSYKTNQPEKILEASIQMENQLEAFGLADTPNTRDLLIFKGLADLTKGKSDRAAGMLREAWDLRHRENSPVEDHIVFLYYLGEANLLVGDLEAARQNYQGGLNLTISKVWFGDLWAKSHYRLGEIYEKLGNRERAIEHYEKFLDIWKDADPGIAELEDAKKRLAGLKKP